MNRIIIAVIITLFFTACRPSNYGGKVKPSDSIKTVVDSPNIFQLTDSTAPDVHFLRQRLLSFFERHRSEDVFDTMDYVYKLYWGPGTVPPYGVEAGHLFSNTELHAILFYVDDLGSLLRVYHKENGQWKKIFEDTAADMYCASCLPGFQDWNHDGIKDLYIYHQSPNASVTVIDKVDVWLMDKRMNRLHAIPGFSELNNPEVDSITGTITSSYYHQGEHTSTYKFSGTKLIKLSEKWERDE